MKKIIKHDSVLSFIDEVSYIKTNRERDRGLTCNYFEVHEKIHIRNDQGIDPGDRVEFHFDEYTNMTRQPVPTKVIYECVAYDDVSNKLIKK